MNSLLVKRKVKFDDITVQITKPFQYFNEKDWVDVSIKEQSIDSIKFDLDKMQDWTSIDGLYCLRVEREE